MKTRTQLIMIVLAAVLLVWGCSRHSLWHELPAPARDQQVPDSALVQDPDAAARLAAMEKYGFRLPVLYRHVIALRLTSSDLALLGPVLTRHRMQLVAYHANRAFPIYYATIPDPGPSWSALSAFVTRVEQTEGVVAARTLPVAEPQLTHYVGPLLDGRFYDDRVEVTFAGDVTEQEARAWCTERGGVVLRYRDLNGPGPPAPGTFAAAVNLGPQLLIGLRSRVEAVAVLDSIVEAWARSPTVRFVERLPRNTRIRVRGAGPV